MSKAEEILSLRKEGGNEVPKIRKRRQVASAVLNSLVVLPPADRERLKKYWQNIPEKVSVEMAMVCSQAILAIEGGKTSTNAYVAVMNAAYGMASVDADVADTFSLERLSKDDIKRFDDEFKKDY